MKTCTHDSVECFFNTKGEEDFLFSYLKPEMEVLEWGSGSSTVAIAKRVKNVVSIEHSQEYFWKLGLEIAKNNLHNIKSYHIQRNSRELSGNDGTYENYNDYINFPKALNKKFDLIFIDGRARVECAKIAVSLLNENGVILIHDYRNPNPACDRKEYHEVEQFLDIIDFEYALYAFKPKQNG
jgi:predicted O-methyltransferase YrrM